MRDDGFESGCAMWLIIGAGLTKLRAYFPIFHLRFPRDPVISYSHGAEGERTCVNPRTQKCK